MSQGGSLNIEANYGQFRAQIGASILDVYKRENSQLIRTVFSEKWSMTWAITTPLWNEKLRLDYTGNLYGPMRLPLLGELDPRVEFSPVWSIQNLKFSYQKQRLELFCRRKKPLGLDA